MLLVLLIWLMKVLFVLAVIVVGYLFTITVYSVLDYFHQEDISARLTTVGNLGVCRV
jgi:hypothetical protein